MAMIGTILLWAVFGLVCGAIARLLIPGRQPMGIVMTMILGVVGSFVGGFIGYLFGGGEPLQASSLFLSVIGAVIVLAAYIGITRKGERPV